MGKSEMINELHENVIMPEKNFPVRAFYFKNDGHKSLFSSHWHEHFEIIYIVSGTIIIESDGKVIQGDVSDVIIVNPNELHCCPFVSEDLELYCVIFDISILNSRYFDQTESQYIQPILNNSILFDNLIRNDLALNERVLNIYEEMNSLKIGYELAAKSRILDIIVILLRNYEMKIITLWEKRMKTRNNGRVNEVIKYIDENYVDDITLDMLANLIFVSKGYLCKLFKKLLNKNVMDYVNSVRIKAAEGLLEDCDMTISDIALKVGYNDINYFCRIFKKYTGVTPSAKRNKKHITNNN